MTLNFTGKTDLLATKLAMDIDLCLDRQPRDYDALIELARREMAIHKALFGPADTAGAEHEQK